ncbi:methyltransferase-like protein 22 isoform X4 [Heterocephalus glaber]|uniref:Methyltransferase-like protein 22 n=1 Tax=Heterocephalus glaber TaxID=10181 RepID=A0AAX6RXQ2_HETGA|nr:methyltransferase-like protein 22 isoform X4 [Heterocephalus glaber]
MPATGLCFLSTFPPIAQVPAQLSPPPGRLCCCLPHPCCALTRFAGSVGQAGLCGRLGQAGWATGNPGRIPRSSVGDGNLQEPGRRGGEHTMATPLEDVGKQVWQGALFLADYILFRRDLFQGRTVLELGAGTGFASIVAATMAQTVYCTDVGADLLAMCQQNIALNTHLAAAGGGVVKVRELDWLKDKLCTDPEVPFSWSEEDISDLYDHTTVLFAAEVFYDDDLTDALFRTLCQLSRRLKNACTALLSVEKRFNFTLRHLDVTCEAYDHFRSSLHALEKLSDGKLRFVVEPVEASFPQLLIYERIQHLELWKIIAEPIT